MHNGGVVPVYLGTSEHDLVLNDITIVTLATESGGWMGPGFTATVRLEETVHIQELPGAAVLDLGQGGQIDVQVNSKAGCTVVSKAINTEVTRFNVTETIEAQVRRLLNN